MKFIEMTGHALMSMIEPDEVSPEKLQQVGLTDTCLVRVNEQGDVEVRRHDRWDLIEGLVGGFAQQLEKRYDEVCERLASHTSQVEPEEHCGIACIR